MYPYKIVAFCYVFCVLIIACIICFLQKFLHAISPTPASVMSAVEICKKPSNTSLSPYIDLAKISQAEVEIKRPAESDTQYWRYDVSQKRQKTGPGEAERRCFNYVSSGSCPRGEKCHFLHDYDAREQYLRGVCFDFLNKGKCERGPDCSFKHSLQDTAEGLPNRRTGYANVHRLVVFFIFCKTCVSLIHMRLIPYDA